MKLPQLFLLIFTAIFVVGLTVYIGYGQKTAAVDPESIIETYEQNNEPVFASIRDSLKLLILDYGIDGVMKLTKHAFVTDKIGMYQCHVLLHTIGHEAVVYYDYDYEKVLEQNTATCELGYRHGAEAQVVLSGRDYLNEIETFCSALQRNESGAECFHGAGHAFMHDTLDVPGALVLCDTLLVTGRPVEPCYNAVFAELTNLVGGSDGATGVAYTNGPPMTLEGESPIDYCSKFAEKHRYQCVFEFSGLGVSEASQPEDIEIKLKQCTNGDYDIELEEGCIKSVAAVGAQHELAVSESITFPEHILLLPDSLRESYIRGAGTEMLQYIISGAPRDWVGFCANFSETRDIEFCNRIFDGYN